MLNNVSVIIVTHNHRIYIEKCLDSIPNGIEVLIVDNVSTDGTPELIEKKYPHITLLKNDENLGYGKGVNSGVKISKKEYLIILNPDTFIQADSFENLFKPLINHVDIITVPKVLLYDGSKINTCGNIEHFTGLTFTRGLGEDKDSYNDTEYLNGLSGVCFAMRKDLYDKIGGFDESIFLYMEDTELSWRLNSLGLKIQYIPDSIIYHDYKLTVSPEKIFHLERGRYIILRKYFTWKLFILFFPSLIVSEIYTMGYSLLNGKDGVKFKIKAIKEGLSLDIKEKNFTANIKSLDWKVPYEQLSHNRLDKTVRIIGNIVYYLNYYFVIYLINFKTSK